MAWENEEDMSTDHEFIPAVFARSVKEAEEFRELLEDHGIKALVGTEADESDAETDVVSGRVPHGVPVLVPGAFLDEAGEIIADREDTDEFDLGEKAEDEDDDDEFGLGDADDENSYFQFDDGDSEVLLDDDDEEEEDEFLDAG